MDDERLGKVGGKTGAFFHLVREGRPYCTPFERAEPPEEERTGQEKTTRIGKSNKHA